MSSIADGSTPDRPRVTLAITGKNDRTAAIIILLSGLSRPNQVLNSGAKAMIGIALAAIASGSSSARAVPQRAARNATTTPAVVPMRKPPTASMIVLRAEAASGNRSPFQFSTSAAPIADGAGRMNELSPIPRMSTSHRTSPPSATSTAGR